MALTDSRLSNFKEEKVGESQKLFRLDDRSICLIAGTYGLGFGPNAEAFVGDVRGVVAQYVTKLSELNRVVSIEEKTATISYLISSAFEIRFEMYSRVATSVPDNNPSQVIVAGYDVDGKLKIAKTSFSLKRRPDGRFDMVQIETSIQAVDQGFNWTLGGEEYPASHLLDSDALPSVLMPYSNDKGLSRYRALKNEGGAGLLDTDDLLTIARLIKTVSSDLHKGVGDDEQFAVLGGGRIERFVVPAKLLNAPFTTPLELRVVEGFNTDLKAGLLAARVARSEQFLFLSDVIHDGKVDLDNDYFYHSLFKNITIEYNGGIGYIDKNCKFINTKLVLGPAAHLHGAKVQDLLKRDGVRRSAQKYSVKGAPLFVASILSARATLPH